MTSLSRQKFDVIMSLPTLRTPSYNLHLKPGRKTGRQTVYVAFRLHIRTVQHYKCISISRCTFVVLDDELVNFIGVVKIVTRVHISSLMCLAQCHGAVVYCVVSTLTVVF